MKKPRGSGWAVAFTRITSGISNPSNTNVTDVFSSRLWVEVMRRRLQALGVSMLRGEGFRTAGAAAPSLHAGCLCPPRSRPGRLLPCSRPDHWQPATFLRQYLQEMASVAAVRHRFRQPAKALKVDKPHPVGDLLRAGDHHPLALLHRLHKAPRLHQRLMRPCIEPGNASSQQQDL